MEFNFGHVDRNEDGTFDLMLDPFQMRGNRIEISEEDAAALAAYILNGGDTEAPFYCLDEGDGKPRCQVQCPYCEKGL